MLDEASVTLPAPLSRLLEASRIKVEPRLEGNKVVDGVLSLGMRAGPKVEVDNLLHEMSHFVEIDEPRMLVHGWGLSYKNQFYLLGHLCIEPNTIQGIERECRVLAYQNHLRGMLGMPGSPEEDAPVLRFLADWSNIPIERDPHLYRENEDRRAAWVAQRIRKLMETHTLERFMELWYTRNEKLLEMELPA